MKLDSKFLVLILSLLASLSVSAASPSTDCVSCTKKTIGSEVQKTVMELNKDVSSPLALASKVESSEILSQDDYQYMFCHKFAQIESQLVASLLGEMEKTTYPVDDYFKSSTCQPEGYGGSVKSPILHTVADDPSKRVKFLDIMWLYYSKKRKEPSKFAEVVNAKNTKGETLLDYFESRKKEPSYANIMKESIDKIVAVACSHGAVYSAYPDKKCP